MARALPGLAHHLDANYQRIWKSADCQIYALSRPDWSQPRGPEARETALAPPTSQADHAAPPAAAPDPVPTAAPSVVAAAASPAAEKLSKYALYARLIGELRQLVPTIVPEHSTLMVISRGDEELLKINRVTAWHFPQATNGVYAGHHPADDHAAISHLNSLLRMGGQYPADPQHGVLVARLLQGVRPSSRGAFGMLMA